MRYRLVCFDVDGTLLDDTVFIWDTLHNRFRVPERERKEAYDAYFAGEITYAQWAERDITHWRKRGVTRDDIVAVARELRPMPGARDVLEALTQAELHLAVVSGTLDLALETAFPDYRSFFDHVFLNRLQFDQDGLVTSLDSTPYDVERKGDGLREVCRRVGCSLEESVFIGDNFNDLSAARIAGLSIAFNCKSKELEETADVVIEKKDLRLVLPLILGDS